MKMIEDTFIFKVEVENAYSLALKTRSTLNGALENAKHLNQPTQDIELDNIKNEAVISALEKILKKCCG